MKKKILITICDQCPNKDREDGWCFIVERHVGSPIPEDCELRDAEDDENKYAALLARHNALREAVKRLRKIEGNKSLHPVVDGLLIAARAEVDRLLQEPPC